MNLALRRLVFLTLGSLGLFVTATTTFAAPIDDVKEASRLYQQGKLDAALAKLSTALAAQPKDAQGRFLKGLIFTEQKKSAEAIQIFTGLTEDYPELPEPYNNLAVLYASQGNYDKARAALELAIHTHPTYATAHENLGDIYAQLARRAYDKALQLDKTNVTAQSKLAMVKDLFVPPKAIEVAEPVKTPPTTVASTKVAQVDAPKGSAAPVKPPAKPSSQATSTANVNEQVAATLQAWARAWATKDVAGYLAFYAPDFETPDSMPRATWEQQRRDRIQAPSRIVVKVGMLKVVVKDGEAVATFRQSYQSDKLTSNNTKTIKLVKVGDGWLIRSERVGS